MADSNMSSGGAEAHWAKTKGLMITTMIIWFVFSFGIHFFVDALNGIVIFGFPMGWYMAAQGSLIVFVVLIFVQNKMQDKIDDDAGFLEN